MKKKERYTWADNARGIGIFLVIYAHNFPFLEHYIYSFHIPLFFFIAGMFHPKEVNFSVIIYRAKSILLPYFIWSILLYLFWLFFGRHYGNSLKFNLDPINGLIGVFYAQGGIEFMDWGIPMWFLPCVFISFLLFSLVVRIKKNHFRYLVWLLLVIFGFTYSKYFEFRLPWSLDVACVSLIFYGIGFYLKDALILIKKRNSNYLILIGFLIVSIVAGIFNSKIDMYRATYGNFILFILSGIAGIFVIIFLTKTFKLHKTLTFLGKNTIPLLALQVRALTIVKLVLIIMGITVFNFNDLIKFILTFIQILLIIPVILVVNKYVPILNGKFKD